MTEQFANNAVTTLNGGILATDTSLTVTSATAFPLLPQFRIIVDSEIMLVTGVAGNVFTITRAMEGTIAAGHLSGATVSQILTAGALVQLKTDVATTSIVGGRGLYSARPSASSVSVGYVYRCTDVPFEYFSDGTNWNQRGPIIDIPASGPYSTWNGGTPLEFNVTGTETRTVVGDSIFFKTTSTASILHGWIKGNVSGLWTVYSAILPAYPGNTSFPMSGPIVYDSVHNQFASFWFYATGGTLEFNVRHWTGASSATNVFDSTTNPTAPFGPLINLRIRNDGTNINYEYSTDSFDWVTIFSEAVGAFGTYNQYGFGLCTFGAASAGSLCTSLHT